MKVYVAIAHVKDAFSNIEPVILGVYDDVDNAKVILEMYAGQHAVSYSDIEETELHSSVFRK